MEGLLNTSVRDGGWGRLRLGQGVRFIKNQADKSETAAIKFSANNSIRGKDWAKRDGRAKVKKNKTKERINTNNNGLAERENTTTQRKV